PRALRRGPRQEIPRPAGQAGPAAEGQEAEGRAAAAVFTPGGDQPFSCGLGAPPDRHLSPSARQLKLVNPTQYRFEHLATQLKWRLQEGRGEAVYQIGVEDNGLLVGLSDRDMRASLGTLRRMAEKYGRLRDAVIPLRSCRKIFLDLRVAVLGNVDSGKSTLLGVLTQGELDNGRGRARLNLFRHLHEIQTGRTSSISFEILGFNSKGEVVNYSDSRTAEEICESSSKMITFIDLAGHHKYLKTTIFGLTSYCPDFAMLVVGANTGVAGTTREHLGLAMALKVPIFIVVSKVDVCVRGAVERTVRQLERLLKQPGCGKVPLLVASGDDAVTAAQQFTQTSSVTPIFLLSSVSGQNLDLLKVFFNILPPLTQVDEIYTVPDVGTVVGGTLGVCREGERLVVGPTDDGRFLRLKVCSIQRNRSACRVLRAGQAATLALGNFPRALLRKGMVMVSPKMNPTICWQFEASIVLLFHAKTFRRGFQVTVHVGNVRQTATEELRTGERAVVRFRFMKHPEYLRVGAKLLFREGVTKGIGHVAQLLAHDQNRTHIKIVLALIKQVTNMLVTKGVHVGRSGILQDCSELFLPEPSPDDGCSISIWSGSLARLVPLLPFSAFVFCATTDRMLNVPNVNLLVPACGSGVWSLENRVFCICSLCALIVLFKPNSGDLVCMLWCRCPYSPLTTAYNALKVCVLIKMFHSQLLPALRWYHATSAKQ
uniref:Tr-type G domain-containing protein n=1 Tax=Denticeps clupeoides TaxID=299321 RepID=A0AAY4A4G5_9TELE